MYKNIPEVFESDDTIFHYTNLITSLEYILFKGELRMSPRFNSSDPIENVSPSISMGLMAGTHDEVERIEKSTTESSERISDYIKERLNISKQICFCMNDKSLEKYRNIGFSYEYYGFLKPRMWEQYADN